MPTSIPQVTPLPDPPQPGVPATFNTLAPPFVLAMQGLSEELVDTIDAMNDAVQETEDNANSAETDAATATTKAAEAAASANTAVNAPGTSGTSTTSNAIPTSGLPVSKSFTTQTAKNWQGSMTVKVARTSAPNNWMLGTITSYDSGTGALVVNVTHAQGTGTYTDWTISLAAPIMSTVANSVVSKSSGFTAYKYDKGSVYDCSATLTAALDAIATLEAGWYAYYTAPASGTVTIDPNSTEQIGGPGLTTGNTQTISNGESCVVIAGASAFTMIKFQSQSGSKLLSTLTLTASAACDALTVFTSDYDSYMVIGTCIASNAQDTLSIRFANAGSVDTGNKYYNPSTGSSDASASNLANISPLNSVSGDEQNFTLFVHNVNDTTGLKTAVNHGVTQSTAGQVSAIQVFAAYDSANAVSGLRFLWSGGSSFLAQGKIRIYGLRNS